MRVFENLEEYASQVGQEIGVSDWMEVDQDRINMFAEATGDHQWIHLDAERTQKELGMPTIAHGFLTLSLLPVLSGQISGVKSVTRGINYGSNKTRFTSMVPVNSKLRARAKLVGAEPKAGGVLFTSEVSIEVEGSDMPALVTESLTLLFE
ncbi:MAG: MaoC family dehydratase [Alphaproteobacteria bacterium]|nr:MaoC family dehydratase [Alphaproteobacteria bacterium]